MGGAAQAAITALELVAVTLNSNGGSGRATFVWKRIGSDSGPEHGPVSHPTVIRISNVSFDIGTSGRE